MYNGRWLANKWIHIIHQNLIKEGWTFWYVNLIQTNDSVAWNVWQNGLDFRKAAHLTNNKHHAGVFGLILVPKYNVSIQNQDKNIPSAEHHGGRFFLNPIVDSRPWTVVASLPNNPSCDVTANIPIGYPYRQVLLALSWLFFECKSVVLFTLRKRSMGHWLLPGRGMLPSMVSDGVVVKLLACRARGAGFNSRPRRYNFRDWWYPASGYVELP